MGDSGRDHIVLSKVQATALDDLDDLHDTCAPRTAAEARLVTMSVNSFNFKKAIGNAKQNGVNHLSTPPADTLDNLEDDDTDMASSAASDEDDDEEMPALIPESVTVDTDDAPAVPGWAASFTGYDEDEEGSCGDEDDDAIPELLDTDANDDSDIDATLPALLHQESSDSEGGDIGDTGDDEEPPPLIADRILGAVEAPCTVPIATDAPATASAAMHSASKAAAAVTVASRRPPISEEPVTATRGPPPPKAAVSVVAASAGRRGAIINNIGECTRLLKSSMQDAIDSGRGRNQNQLKVRSSLNDLLAEIRKHNGDRQISSQNELDALLASGIDGISEAHDVIMEVIKADGYLKLFASQKGDEVAPLLTSLMAAEEQRSQQAEAELIAAEEAEKAAKAAAKKREKKQRQKMRKQLAQGKGGEGGDDNDDEDEEEPPPPIVGDAGASTSTTGGSGAGAGAAAAAAAAAEVASKGKKNKKAKKPSNPLFAAALEEHAAQVKEREAKERVEREAREKVERAAVARRAAEEEVQRQAAEELRRAADAAAAAAAEDEEDGPHTPGIAGAGDAENTFALLAKLEEEAEGGRNKKGKKQQQQQEPQLRREPDTSGATTSAAAAAGQASRANAGAANTLPGTGVARPAPAARGANAPTAVVGGNYRTSTIIPNPAAVPVPVIASQASWPARPVAPAQRPSAPAAVAPLRPVPVAVGPGPQRPLYPVQVPGVMGYRPQVMYPAQLGRGRGMPGQPAGASYRPPSIFQATGGRAPTYQELYAQRMAQAAAPVPAPVAAAVRPMAPAPWPVAGARGQAPLARPQQVGYPGPPPPPRMPHPNVRRAQEVLDNHRNAAQRGATMLVGAAGGGRDEEEGDGECCICMEEPPGVVLMPCNHINVCVNCLPSIMETQPALCPVCRAAIQDTHIL